VHDKFIPAGGTKVTSTAAFDTIASASVPQSQGVSEVVPAGKWKVRFGVENDPNRQARPQGDGARSSRAVTARSTAAPSNVTIHVPPGLKVDGTTVDSTKAATNPGIKERLDTFFKVTSQLLGIERGTVTFRAAKSSLVDLDDNEIIDGFAVSTGETDGTQNLHILYTNSIRQGGQPIAIGISPGIPGAASLFGRGVSGIIVVPGSTGDDDVLTMVHEMGHFIGLNHTTSSTARARTR